MEIAHKTYDEIVEKQHRKTINEILTKNPLLSQEQKNTLYRYEDFLESRQKQVYNSPFGYKRHLKPLTSFQSITSYLRDVIDFGEYLDKPYEEATRDDIDNYRTFLKKTPTLLRKKIKKAKKNGEDHTQIELDSNEIATYITQYTLESYCNLIKRFYIWLYNRDNLENGEVPYLVKHLQKTKELNKPKVIEPNRLIKPNEALKFVEVTNKPRDKAIMSLLFEANIRAGELVALNIGDVQDEGDFGFINVDGKTDKRRPGICDSLIYIRKWINEHPFKDNPNAPLFIGLSPNGMHGRLTRRGATHIVARVAKEIKFDKKYNLHFWRHSGIDDDYKSNKFNERDLKFRNGWSEKSEEHLRYVHYGEEESNRKYFEAKGIKISKENTISKALEPKICTKCKELYPSEEHLWKHPPTARFCLCGQVLDKDEIYKIKKLREDEKKFYSMLMSQQLSIKTETSKEFNESVVEMILKNPLLREKFNETLRENEVLHY